MAEMRMTLEPLPEKRGVAADFLRETLTFVLEPLMECEVTGLRSGKRHERSALTRTVSTSCVVEPMRSASPDAPAPRLRVGGLFYVAVTRARDELVTTAAKNASVAERGGRIPARRAGSESQATPGEFACRFELTCAGEFAQSRRSHWRS